VQNTFATFWRFVINSTFGIGGIFDVASEAGLKNRTADLGQTFGVHGADAGPYIMIPIMGPSNVRDALGRVGDIFFFPPNYSSEWAVPLSIGAVSAVDARSNNMELIDGVYRSSLDPYATFRSGYMQRRVAEIKKAKEARDASVAKMSNNTPPK
jgi:phospholipid-binding lipoprotein MlaA